MSLRFVDDPTALDRVLASLPEIILKVDRDGIIRYINRVEPGYDREAIPGRSAWHLLFGDSRGTFQTAFHAVLATGESREIEVEATHADGSRTWYRTQLLPYRLSNEIEGVVVIAENFTELRQAQQDLARLKHLLPICAYCGDIQNETGQWESLERYLEDKVDTRVSHGMCPKCYRREKAELDGEGRG